MARADKQFAIRTQGLGQLNRSLGRISQDLRRDSLRELRDIAKQVRGTSQTLAPRRTGKLAGSMRYSATNRGATIRSGLVYAPIHEYGGTITPRGSPIEIPRSRFVGRAIQQDARDIEDRIGDLVDRVGRRNGFR